MADLDDVTQAVEPTSGARRKHMAFFRASEARGLGHEQAPFVGMDEGVLAGFAKLRAAGATEAMGAITTCLFREPEAAGLSLCHAWFKSDVILLRHSHSADCIYYILSGEIIMGARTVGIGDGVFIPANNGYTLQAGSRGAEVLEFRNAAEFNVHFKGNDEALWDQMVQVQTAKMNVWPSEVPPSKRSQAEQCVVAPLDL